MLSHRVGKAVVRRTPTDTRSCSALVGNRRKIFVEDEFARTRMIKSAHSDLGIMRKVFRFRRLETHTMHDGSSGLRIRNSPCVSLGSNNSTKPDHRQRAHNCATQSIFQSALLKSASFSG